MRKAEKLFLFPAETGEFWKSVKPEMHLVVSVTPKGTSVAVIVLSSINGGQCVWSVGASKLCENGEYRKTYDFTTLRRHLLKRLPQVFASFATLGNIKTAIFSFDWLRGFQSAGPWRYPSFFSLHGVRNTVEHYHTATLYLYVYMHIGRQKTTTFTFISCLNDKSRLAFWWRFQVFSNGHWNDLKSSDYQVKSSACLVRYTSRKSTSRPNGCYNLSVHRQHFQVVHARGHTNLSMSFDRLSPADPCNLTFKLIAEKLLKIQVSFTLEMSWGHSNRFSF